VLVKIAPLTNDFHAMARYLVSGKQGSKPDPRRVLWVLGHNLPTNDPELAAKYMTATAAQSVRTRNAAYHLMIAWHEEERPTVEAMQEVARETMMLAGLGEHQALIMGHGDKQHPHLHILCNRVHPDTGRAWKTSHDYVRFDRIMQRVAETRGFAYVPAHSFNPALTADKAKQPNSPATYAARRGADTSRVQWSRNAARALGERLSEDLTRTSTAEEVLAYIEDLGLELEPKGRGHVIGNADGYVKLSSVMLHIGTHGRARLHAAATGSPRSRVPQRPLLSVDKVDIARAMATWGLVDEEEVARAIDEARRERQERAAARRAHSPILRPEMIPARAPRRRPGLARSRGTDTRGR